MRDLATVTWAGVWLGDHVKWPSGAGATGGEDLVGPQSRRRPMWVGGLDRGGGSGRDWRTATKEGSVMSSDTIVTTGPRVFDEGRLAAAGFLARYSGSTR